MIWHCTRFTVKPDADQQALQAALDSLRNQGESIDAVKQYIVGPDIGGEYEWSACYILEGIDGYWEYLMAPSHRHTDEIGLPLIDQFVSYDVTDDPDPQIGEKIAELHRRRYEGDPGLTELVSDLPSYTGSAAPDENV